MSKFLTPAQKSELLRELRLERLAKYSDRIKCVLLLDQGKTPEQIASYLFLSINTVNNYKIRYLTGGMDELTEDDYKGSECRLSEMEQKALICYMEENVCSDAKLVKQYILENYNKSYSVGGLRHLLKRLGFVYKKTKIIPGKADSEKQIEFLNKFNELKTKKENPIYFLDGVHPHHNTRSSYAWIKKGKDKEIKANTGRERININGAINAHNPCDVIVREDESINAQSTIALLKQIEDKNPESEKIIVIADNAKYYKNKLVKEYLETSRIQVYHLPAYSPNLNLIERLWKFMYKKVINNVYHHKFKDFKSAVMGFFDNITDYAHELETLMALNFRVIGSKTQ